MVAVYGHQHFFSVEAPSAYVHPQPGSHANRVGLYSDELVATSNPSIGEEAGMEAVLDTAAERRLCLDATEEAVVLSRLGVDPTAAMMCASLPPTRCRGATRTPCTWSSRKGVGNEANDGCTGRPLATE
jgi:hypothetical protein